MAFFTKMGMSVPEIKTENLEELKQSLEQYEVSEELELVRAAAAGTTTTDQNDSTTEEEDAVEVEKEQKQEVEEEIKNLVPDVVIEGDENKSDEKRFEYVVDRNFGVEV